MVSRERKTDGVAGKLAVVGLLVLAACVLVTFTSTTLTVTRAASTEESRAAARIYRLHGYVMGVGALAGVLVCASSVFVAIRQLCRGAALWSGLLFLAGAAAVAASGDLLWGTCTGATVESLPVAGHWRSRLSAIALAGASAVWAFRCWRGQWQRIKTGEWKDAEGRIATCLKRTGWRELLGCLPGMIVSAGIVAVVVAAPVGWVVFHNAGQKTPALFGAVALGSAGVVLFCILQCLVLSGILTLLIALARSGWICGIVSLTIGFIAGMSAFLFAYCGLSLSFMDELEALNMTTLVGAVLFGPGLFFGVALSGNLLELSSGPRYPRNLRDLIRICILAGVLLPVLPVIKRIRGRIRPSRPVVAAGCAAIVLGIAILVLNLFPRVRDFLDRIELLLVTLIVLLMVLLGHVIAPPAGNWRTRLATLVVLVGVCVFIVVYSEGAMAYVRPDVFRYDPLGKCSLHVIEKVMLPVNAPAKFGAEFTVPRLLAPPTKRRAVMDKLKQSRPLIILVIWDACRKDHTSIFGYRRTKPPLLPTTPNLDRHRDQLLRFSNAFSQGTATTCSMRHLFTGRYSSRWMLKPKGVAPFWLNELMRCGYHSFFLNIIGSDYNGLSLGAFYRDMPKELRSRLEIIRYPGCAAAAGEEKVPAGTKATAQRSETGPGKIRFLECNQQDEREAVRDLLALLKTRAETKAAGCFAYIHMNASHTPWRRYEEVEDFGDDEQNRYDQAIRYSDFVTGELIRGLKELSMWDDAVLIVTADHGTGLKDHGVFGGYHPWREQVSIPLVVKLPGVRGRRIDALVGLFDIGPTFMDIFAPEKLSRYEGRSLWPIILGQQRWNDRVLFGLNSFADCYFLVQADGLHYIRHRPYRYEQLFNWRTDPHQKRDLMRIDKRAADRVRSRMDWFLNVYGRGRSFNDPYHYKRPPHRS